MAETALRGVTWEHSRGFDPMVATSEIFARETGVRIIWEKRSLQAFADRPIAEMADDFDLMVIDHPHVGEASRAGLLLALDGQGHDDDLADLAANSVGLSHPSYEFDGRQWALAIDAATPVAALRPDLLAEAPAEWDEVLELARAGRVAFALIPVNALMNFFGLARNMGHGIGLPEGRLIDPAAGMDVLERLREIVALIPEACLALDPIGIYEWMGRRAGAPAYSPFGYGYTNYSRTGYCRFPLLFRDAPGAGGAGPRGTVLGGAGIAVSARTRHPGPAVDYAFRVAGRDWQTGAFFDAGGQPAHADAWEDDRCNAETRNFFRGTRRTLESAWLRPRHDGYMAFQDRGGDLVHACLRGEAGVAPTLAALQTAWEESL